MLFNTAVNCTFINNNATHRGGALSNGTAINCTFENNWAQYAGGAISEGIAINSTFINNSAFAGGGMYYSNATNCSFIDNKGKYNMEAMDHGYANYCTFENNAVYKTIVQYRFDSYQVEPVDSIQFIGLPYCNLKITVTKGDKSQIFYYSSNGWNIHDMEPGVYKVKIEILSEDIFGSYETEITVNDGLMPMDHLNNLVKDTQNKTITLDYDYYCYDINQNYVNGILINKSMTIDGQGHKINANYKMRIFQVTNGANVTFKNITFLNAATTGTGGAIWNNEANVTAIDCTFENNVASYGGALFNVNAEYCTFKNNQAFNVNYGGGAM